MVTVPTTGPDTDGQLIDALIVAAPVSDHDPGPRSGTTATAKSGDNVPASAPLAALTDRARAFDFAFEAVATDDGGAVVRVAGARVVVVVTLAGDGRVVVVDGTLAGGAVVVEVVACDDTVNSRTRSK